ncbi:MAG: choice-of-anchor D domain-containing protein [Deltaproteobacteria bacterium]|nr:choice-of-anchor D domain-containing protein [Deltaproteobacteria bacterium]
MKSASVSSLLLATLFAMACSDDPTGPQGPLDTLSCQGDEDCPSGSCVGGQCVSFTPSDVKEEADALQTDAPAPTDQGDQGPGTPDVPPAEDAVLPEEVKPQDVYVDTSVPDILVDPLKYTFSYLPGVQNPETKNVSIYNQGKGALVITKIEWAELSSPDFKFMALPPMPKKLNQYDQATVTVVFQDNKHGPAVMRIHSNDPDTPVAEVQFNSQSKAEDQPCISITPSYLNFGQVVRGETKTLPFQIVNCSSTFPLTVTNIKRSKFFGMELTKEFQIEPSPNFPIAIPANSVYPLNVSYTPGLAGLDSGYFLIVSTDPTTPEAKLDVVGIGVPPPLEEIGLHIELEWDTDDCDVDLHFLKPGADLFDCDNDCFYANPNPDWDTKGDFLDDPFLDYDDVDGYGPENTNISEPKPGTYKVVMHYYKDNYEGYGGGSTNATVRIYSYGQLLQTFGPTLLKNTNKTWDVCTVDWPSATVKPLGQVYDHGETNVCLPW